MTTGDGLSIFMLYGHLTPDLFRYVDLNLVFETKSEGAGPTLRYFFKSEKDKKEKKEKAVKKEGGGGAASF